MPKVKMFDGRVCTVLLHYEWGDMCSVPARLKRIQLLICVFETTESPQKREDSFLLSESDQVRLETVNGLSTRLTKG
jgi:ubiquitin-protein ligase